MHSKPQLDTAECKRKFKWLKCCGALLCGYKFNKFTMMAQSHGWIRRNVVKHNGNCVASTCMKCKPYGNLNSTQYNWNVKQWIRNTHSEQVDTIVCVCNWHFAFVFCFGFVCFNFSFKYLSNIWKWHEFVCFDCNKWELHLFYPEIWPFFFSVFCFVLFCFVVVIPLSKTNSRMH